MTTMAFEWGEGVVFGVLGLLLGILFGRVMLRALQALEATPLPSGRANAIMGVVLALFCVAAFANGPLRLAALGFGLSLWVLAWADWHTGFLPDTFTLPLVWAGLLVNLYAGYIPLEAAVLGAVLGYGLLWVLVQGFYWTTGRHGMGYGDLKLTAALGAWLGWQALVPVLLIASLSGLLWVLLCKIFYSGRWARVIVFGPWLALAGFIQFLVYHK